MATAVLDELLLYLIVRVILDNAVDRLHSNSSVGKDWLQQCWKRLVIAVLEEMVTAVLEEMVTAVLEELIQYLCFLQNSNEQRQHFVT